MLADNKKSSARWTFFDCFILIALCSAAICALPSNPLLNFIFDCDENSYLVIGRVFGRGIAVGWSPLYSLWYYVLLSLGLDPLSAYHLNTILTVILPIAAVYLLSRCLGGTAMVSAAASLWLLTRSDFLEVCPRVHHFLVVVICGFVFLSLRASDRLSALVILAVGSIVGAYIRPELIGVAMIMLAISLSSIIFAVWRRTLVRGFLVKCALLVVSFGTAFLIGLPPDDEHFNRSLDTFSQNFARNWKIHAGGNFDPFLDGALLTDKLFGPIDGYGSAFKANPSLFLWHVSANIKRLPGALYDFISAHTHLRFLPLQIDLAALFLLVAIIATLLQPRKVARDARPPHQTLCLAYLLLVILPALAGLLLVFPESRYLIFPGSILLIVLAVGASYGAIDTAASKMLTAAASMTAVFLIDPAPVVRDPILGTAEIRVVQNEVERCSSDVLFSSSTHLLPYLPFGSIMLTPRELDSPWADFARRNGIRITVVDRRLKSDSRLNSDDTWTAMLNYPATFGFQQSYANDEIRILSRP